MQTARATIVCSHEDRSAERPRYIWGIFLISTCTLALTCSNFHFCKIWLALLAINSALWRGGEVRLKQKKTPARMKTYRTFFVRTSSRVFKACKKLKKGQIQTEVFLTVITQAKQQELFLTVKCGSLWINLPKGELGDLFSWRPGT